MTGGEMAKPIPKIERLRELFQIDVERGILVRKVSTSSRARAGEQAGSLHKASGYRFVRVDGFRYREHTLIWFMLHGEWLPRLIDHEDRDRSNNRPSNLRKATESQQHQNAKVRIDNVLGVRGVRRIGSKFAARFVLHGKEKHLGMFASQDAAAEAAATARLAHFGRFAPEYDQVR